MNDAEYRSWELGKVLGDDELRIKVTGDVDPANGLGGTRWLSITRQEFDQITAILTEGK